MYPRIVRQMAFIGMDGAGLAGLLISALCKSSDYSFPWQWCAAFSHQLLRSALFPRPFRAKTRALERLRRDPIRADVRPQDSRDNYAAIRLLIVLDDRDPCTAHCQAAAVQCMDELRFVLSIWPVANVGPPCLIRFKV